MEISRNNINRLKIVHTFHAEHHITNAAITWSGHRIAVRAEGKAQQGIKTSHVIVWSMDGSRLGSIQGYKHTFDTLDLEFWPDSNHLLLTGEHDNAPDGNMFNHPITWEIGSNERKFLFGNQSFSVNALGISGDGEFLALDTQKHLSVIEFATNREIYKWVGRRDYVKFVFSPDGRYLAFHTQPNVFVVELATGHLIRLPKDPHLLVNFCPDSVRILTKPYLGNTILIHSLVNSEADPVSMKVGDVSAAACSPNNQILVTGTQEGLVQIWNAHDYTELATLPAHQGPVTNVAFTSLGHDMFTAGGNTVIHWKIA